jgi:glutathione S-transferase
MLGAGPVNSIKFTVWENIMYELYFLPGACSLATQVVLRELGQEVKIINRQQVEGFEAINPIGSVPVLVDDGAVLTEGAAIMTYLLKKHRSPLLPSGGAEYQAALQDIMFANATMHPAYSKLFFIAQNVTDEKTKRGIFDAAAESIRKLWDVVESKLSDRQYLGGDHPSAADIMLAVYSRWGDYFPVDISFGARTREMLAAVQSMPSFVRSVQAEQDEVAR